MRRIFALSFALLLLAPTASTTPRSTVNIFDPAVLNILEDTGFSLSEALGGAKTSLTAQIYATNPRYRSFAEIIAQPLTHDSVTDQLPAAIPPGSGDIPEMVRLIRNFEDKGRRSEKDTKGGYYIRQLSNNSQHPYTVESDGDTRSSSLTPIESR